MKDMPLSPPRAILFDWDNTLIDSWGCIQAAMNATLRHMGHAEWSMEDIKGRVALSMRDSFPALFGDRWPEARDVFYAAYASQHITHLTPLPGVAAMLEHLHGLGVYLGVVSNKNGRFLREEAAHLGWDRWFGRLVGATDAEADKPSPAPVHLALSDSGIAPGAQVWFVGDAAVDMQCAAASGCTPILLGEISFDEDTFLDFPPQRHILHPDHFVALVRELLVPISPN